MNFLQLAQDAAQKAKEKAAELAERARDVDFEAIQQRATAAAEQLQKKASSVASDIYERASHKEVVVVEGHPLQLVKELAEGGFGFVYLGRHTQTGKDYAVKRMIGQDRESSALAAAEIALLAALQHPNIIKLIASSHAPREGGGTDFLLVMELAANGTLARWVTPDDEGVMPARVTEERLLSNIHDVCKAVAFMHARSPALIHYDLKLENVLETRRGVCKLCDFGSASTRTFKSANATRKERLDEEDLLNRMSTMMYRAPEMMDVHSNRGDIGPAADVWALGIMTFVLAFQTHPFDAGGGQVTSLGILNGRLTLPDPCPFSPGVGRLIAHALTKDPAKRPAVTDLIPLITKTLAESTEGALSPVGRGGGHSGSGSSGGHKQQEQQQQQRFAPSAVPGFDDLMTMNSGPSAFQGTAEVDLLGSSAIPAQTVPQFDVHDVGGQSSGFGDWAAFGVPDTHASPSPTPAFAATSAATASDDLFDLFGSSAAAAAPPISTPNVFPSTVAAPSDLLASLEGTPAAPAASDPMGDLMASLNVSSAPGPSAPGPLPDLTGGSDVFAEPASLAQGATVVIQGLQAKPEYNGERATLGSFDMQKQRWNVTVEVDGSVLALKPTNLVPVQ